MTTLEFLRRQRGISQKQLAEAVGLNAAVVSHVERKERRAYPKARRLLSAYFGLPETALFGEDGYPLEFEPPSKLA